MRQVTDTARITHLLLSSSASQRATNHLLVVGGNGFVGSAVCEEAVRRGIKVTSLSRRGTPPPHIQSGQQTQITTPGWHQQVEWRAGDLMDTNDAWQSTLDQVSGVISCVGGFGTNAQMEKINGDTNANLAQLASKHKVPRFVYVSAVPYAVPKLLLPGYVNGKLKAESAVKEHFLSAGNKGAILRPGMLYGTRYVQTPAGSVPLPLWAAFQPVELILRLQPFAGLHRYAPLSVADLAKTAVDAATKPDVGGVLEIDDIYQQARA